MMDGCEICEIAVWGLCVTELVDVGESGVREVNSI